MKSKKLGMPTCESVSLLVSEASDRPLGWSERLKMHMHLAVCRHCTRFERQLALLRRLVRRDREGT